MMMSIDGRIPCAEMEKISGGDQYYETLDSLGANASISGRVTAELEFAEKGFFESKNVTPLNKQMFSKKTDSDHYDVIIDTKGKLLWPETTDKPMIVVTSEKVSQEYLEYLDERNISWIACGKERIDLEKTLEILYENFNVKKAVIVGGGHINAGFLEKGLLDEVSVLIGLGIVGKEGMTCLFDGIKQYEKPYQLSLKSNKTFEDGTVWLRYNVK